MQLTVKLFAYFRDNRFKVKVADYPEGTTVETIIRSLGISPDEVGVTMIKSRHCLMTDCPRQNDQLAIFPVIGGG